MDAEGGLWVTGPNPETGKVLTARVAPDGSYRIMGAADDPSSPEQAGLDWPYSRSPAASRACSGD